MMDNPFKNSALTHILVVSDMQAAKQFYTQVLGASVYREYGGDSIVLSFLDNWLLLVTGSGPTQDKPETYFGVPRDKNYLDHAFTIRVEDCRKSYEILKTRGARFITPPFERGQETRCFFRDPDGHLFEISEYRA